MSLERLKGCGGVYPLYSALQQPHASHQLLSHMMRQGFLKVDSTSSNFTTVTKTCNDLEFIEAEA